MRARRTPRLDPVAVPSAARALPDAALSDAPRPDPPRPAKPGPARTPPGPLTFARASAPAARSDAGPHDEVVIEELDLMLSATDRLGGAVGSAGSGLAPSAGAGGGGGATLRALLQPPTRYPLLISVLLMCLQQLSGINNAFNYSTVFLKANGMGDGAVATIAVLMNVGNVFITLLSVYMMDRAGRRPLLLASTAGMAASTVLLTAALALPGRSFTPALSVISILLFVGAFGAPRDTLAAGHARAPSIGAPARAHVRSAARCNPDKLRISARARPARSMLARRRHWARPRAVAAPG